MSETPSPVPSPGARLRLWAIITAIAALLHAPLLLLLQVPALWVSEAAGGLVVAPIIVVGTVAGVIVALEVAQMLRHGRLGPDRVAMLPLVALGLLVGRELVALLSTLARIVLALGTSPRGDVAVLGWLNLATSAVTGLITLVLAGVCLLIAATASRPASRGARLPLRVPALVGALLVVVVLSALIQLTLEFAIDVLSGAGLDTFAAVQAMLAVWSLVAGLVGLGAVLLAGRAESLLRWTAIVLIALFPLIGALQTLFQRFLLAPSSGPWSAVPSDLALFVNRIVALLQPVGLGICAVLLVVGLVLELGRRGRARR
ncbi:hypothetical protein [Brachybacterium sp. J153]|uniref:hypothetical protein n=1 Tax=Brachybacterium sp. J153 TaxID=3116488 RepID=UPI002E7A0425|nr:hypothetical protein [Brachybacterium sp. J153]MEE1617966.1 hypothetical protein [Brachybacterium sp. J153]